MHPIRFVLGKGGVGKSTIARALAALLARRGARVALVEIGDDALGPQARTEAASLQPGVEVLAISPLAALSDAVSRAVGIPVVSRVATRHPVYRAIAEIAPGIKELAVLDRILEVAGEQEVVVDGLATGHGTPFLDAPAKIAPVLSGRFSLRALEIDQALHEPWVTTTIVTLPEETPAAEAMQLRYALRRRSFHETPIVVNRCVPRLFDESATERAFGERAAQEAPAAAIAQACLFVARCERAQREHLDFLPGDSIRIPLLAREEGRIETIAEALGGIL